MALVHLEAVHPGVIESVRRLLAGDNEVGVTAIRDFDQNEYHISLVTSEAEEPIALLVSIKHRLQRMFSENQVLKLRLDKIILRHLTIAFKGKEDRAREALSEMPVEGMLATIRVSLAGQTEENIALNPALLVAAQLRHLVLFAPFQVTFDKYCASPKPGPATAPPTCLPYRENESIYLLITSSGTLTCAITIRAFDEDDAIFIRQFLKEIEFTRKQDKSVSGGPGFTISGMPSSLFTDGFEAREATDGSDTKLFWCVFTIPKSLLDPPEKSEKCILTLINFRQYLLYHIQCCKSYLHSAGRDRVKKLEQVINRAKTNTTGCPRIQIE